MSGNFRKLALENKGCFMSLTKSSKIKKAFINNKPEFNVFELPVFLFPSKKKFLTIL